MAGKRRHWKEKNGRFWARIAVPKNLQLILGKSELIGPLGGDLRTADRNHAAAVARLQAQIAQAGCSSGPDTVTVRPLSIGREITPADHEQAAWTHYTAILKADEEKRASMPTPDEIDAEHESLMQKIDAGEADAARDGGANWEHPIDSLIKFLGHGDARKLIWSNLLEWRDFLLASGEPAKTVSDKYLAAIRAVLKWAHIEELLPSNEAATVRQDVPKKIKSREKGYTTPEAIEILKASINYKPTKASNPSNRESAHLTSAKRWVPLLYAFTRARVTEITQLRKEDIRFENGRWLLRITPEAGSVKTGQYRDVPLHKQVMEL